MSEDTEKEFLSGLTISAMEDSQNGVQLFQQFWQKYQGNIAERKEWDHLLSEFRTRTGKMSSELSLFRLFLRDMPILVALGDWLKEFSGDLFLQEKYLSKLSELLNAKLIPYVNEEGQSGTLEYFMRFGHQEILENIRCIKHWSLFEKEDNVHCYIQFSRHMARQTCGLIPGGVDPDRQRVKNKLVKYETFLDFIPHLAERDALIAKILYFGTPILEEVLLLKKEAVDGAQCCLHFAEAKMHFPKHLMQDLQCYLDEKKERSELLFSNLKGAPVERTHLNQSFARACEKISSKAKITPGNLLKQEGEMAGYKKLRE